MPAAVKSWRPYQGHHHCTKWNLFSNARKAAFRCRYTLERTTKCADRAAMLPEMSSTKRVLNQNLKLNPNWLWKVRRRKIRDLYSSIITPDSEVCHWTWLSGRARKFQPTHLVVPFSTWRDLMSAAIVVRSMLGIDPILYQQACNALRPENAAVVMACLLERVEHIRRRQAICTIS